MVLVLLLAASAIPCAHADEQLQLIEQEIKGGLLYNFLKYTEWPAEAAAAPGTPIGVCLFGGDPFNGRLQPMSGRTVNQRVIQVRRVDNLQEAQGCALVFVDGSQKEAWPTLERAMTGKGILTVSDFDGFAESGGMIEFIRVEKRIGVKVNTDALAKNHFQVQDRLLRLANAVHTNGAER